MQQKFQPPPPAEYVPQRLELEIILNHRHDFAAMYFQHALPINPPENIC